ncbi:YjbQ family protein [Methylolobus aquaticus]|nr:YjbQ family protein [Methylolobus aquaticus]
MRALLRLQSTAREQLIDVTGQVSDLVAQSAVRDGIVVLYAQGATAAMMIQENWDDSVPRDVLSLLRGLIPKGVWQHDQQDGNGDAHLKAGLVGPSETIPVIDGRLGLSRWQNVFFCEFDGPRSERTIVCTVISDRCGSSS